MNLKKERDKALALARKWARQGNLYMTQAMLDRANAFWPASERQVKNLSRLLEAAKHGKTLDPETWDPELDAEMKEALKAAGRSWCGVPGCARCWENFTQLREERHGKEELQTGR